MTQESIDPKSVETQLVLSLDTLGQRYGMLPSKVLLEANTFDLVVMDMAISYENHLHKKDQKGYIPDVALDDLMTMKESIKR